MMFTQSFFPGVLDGICNLKLLCGKSQLFFGTNHRVRCFKSPGELPDLQ